MQSDGPPNNKEKATEGEDSSTTQKKMQGKEGSTTVDCLRGRLLAQRLASKAAKEEADLMGKKMIELERQLKIETKSRNRAEKKLKFAMKKLESLKLSSPLPQFSLSESEDSISSCTFLSGKKEPDEQGPVPQTSEPRAFTVESMERPTEESLIMGDSRVECSATADSSPVHQKPSCEESSSSMRTAHYHDSDYPSQEEAGRIKDTISSERHITDALRQSSVEDKERGQHQMESGGAQDQVENDDNILAIVPANLWPDSDTKQAPTNANIHEVLAALRRAKEQLQSSMRRRLAIGSPPFELYGI